MITKTYCNFKQLNSILDLLILSVQEYFAMQYKGKILSIAGSDPSGGAGIQADIKTITALGCYAAASITAVTVQNTTKVYSIFEIPSDVIISQVKAVINDIKIDCIKIGMIPNNQTIKELFNIIPKNIPLILDPVMISTSGDSLTVENIIESLKKYLIPLVTMITPNIPEAEALTKIKIKDTKTMIEAAEKIMSFGAKSVLLKGGHIFGTEITDILMMNNKMFFFRHQRISPSHNEEQSQVLTVEKEEPYNLMNEFHGTGCSLSSAISCFIAQGFNLKESVNNSLEYLLQAINMNSMVGKGSRTLCHNYILIQKNCVISPY